MQSLTFKQENVDLVKQIPNSMKNKIFLLLSSLLIANTLLKAQESTDNFTIDYTQPKEYILSDISLDGVKFLSKSNLINITGNYCCLGEIF